MRKLLLVLLAVFMLSFGSLISAQDMNMCGNLSEADCALVTESAEAMAALDSASFTMNVNIATIDMGDDFTLSVGASGAYNLGGLSMDSFADIDTNDIAASLDAVKAALATVSANLDLTIVLPADPTIPFSDITLNLALVDGIGYLNFESLGALLGGPDMLEAMGLPTGWAGLDLVDTIDNIAAMMGDLSELDMGDAGMEMSDDEAMAMMNALNQYVMFERGADEGSLAVFTGSFDIGGMLADPTFQGLIATTMEAQGTTMTEEDMAMLSEMGPMLAEAMDMTMTQKINVDTKFLESLEVNMMIDGTAVGEQGTVDFGFAMTFADFNAVDKIAAPDAPVAAFMDLMMLLGAMGGGF